MPYATNDGVRIYYETEGSGPPLFLHCGFTQSLQDWRDAGYVAALRDDYHLVLLDPRGQGKSDKPHDPSAYTHDCLVADIVAVLDAEGVETAHYWGYSFGGRMGFAIAQHAPHRLRSLVVGGNSARPQDPEASRQGATRLHTGAGLVHRKAGRTLS
jgi:pimeloyl-ACP methyl ester carboxylesterase